MQDGHLMYKSGKSQHEYRSQAQKELALMKNEPFSRSKDDAMMNETLKEQEYWDDPLKSSTSSSKSKGSHRQALQGPPNRYNIAPGPQWDGIGKHFQLSA